MDKKPGKFIYWTPRILSIALILFLAMFSLDVFEENYGFWGTIVGLFMHNIPSLVLAIILWISWKKYEIVGGIVYILAGLLYMWLTISTNSDDPIYIPIAMSLILAGPAFFIGVLFLIGWFKKKKPQVN